MFTENEDMCLILWAKRLFFCIAKVMETKIAEDPQNQYFI